MPISKTSCPAIVAFDIDGVVRDVSLSYRRAIADTVEHFTDKAYRPSPDDLDRLKGEGIWNNDWEASQELVYRHFESRGLSREELPLSYEELVDFFQSRYRGPDPQQWRGYIGDEQLLLTPSYLADLTAAGIPWGFFSGAPRAEALYVLETRLGLNSPVLIAMEDAPGKPDPTGLLATIQQLEQQHEVDRSTPVLYVGDTVADMYVVGKARSQQPQRNWLGIGILPPHLQKVSDSHRAAYTEKLKAAGAKIIFSNVRELTPSQIDRLVQTIY
ncbi:MAG: TIGR01548 family HAD-type hydrolase [Cyanosarcina radialis HA8281-LM2]|jgi:HAD superfamily phosphatase|nr:TIGR01548 family HAD-type hydrolase [Cyanosarcina radialis HA8281-LM2]